MAFYRTEMQRNNPKWISGWVSDCSRLRTLTAAKKRADGLEANNYKVRIVTLADAPQIDYVSGLLVQRGEDVVVYETRAQGVMKQKPRFSVRLAIAEHIMEDWMDAKDREYTGRTPCPVYTVGNEYLTATSSSEAPRGNADYRWEEIASDVTARFGWHIWRASDALQHHAPQDHPASTPVIGGERFGPYTPTCALRSGPHTASC